MSLPHHQPEFAHPYEVLAPHTEITVASPNGGAAPLDPASVEAFKEDKICVDFLNNKKQLWEKTEKLDTFLGRAKEFDAIFYVGGHGRKYFPTLRISRSTVLEKQIPRIERKETNKRVPNSNV